MSESGPTCWLRGTVCFTIRWFAIAADGQAIATIDERGRVEVRQAVDGAILERTLDVPGCARSLAISPDGRHLAVGMAESGIVLHRLDRTEPGRVLGVPVQGTSHLDFSPDGRILAVSSFLSRDIILWDLAAARERTTLRGHASPVLRARFAPDGRSIASSSRDDPEILIWDLSRGRPRRRIAGLVSPPSCLAYSPDGRLLAFACYPERVVRVEDIEAGREVCRIPGHSLPTRSLAFSPDGRLLATAADDGGAALWSIDDGREVRRLEARADILRGIAFSADGKSLAAIANDDDVRLWDMSTLFEDRPDRE